MYFAVCDICIYSDIQQQISSVRIYHAIEKGYTHHSGLSCLMVSLTPRALLSEQATLTNGNIKLDIIQTVAAIWKSDVLDMYHIHLHIYMMYKNTDLYSGKSKRPCHLRSHPQDWCVR